MAHFGKILYLFPDPFLKPLNMQMYSQKINAVAGHFKAGDIHLGFRRLVDCVLDTQDLSFYKDCIAFTDWKESEVRTDVEITAKALDLLEKLSHAQVPDPADHVPLLVAENLQKTYGRGKFKLGPISMTIHRGDVWGLVGENGNGKTTLLRMLAKDLSYDAGSLSYHLGEGPLSDYELRTKLTYVPQRTPKWYGSLKTNLKFAASHYGIRGEANELTVLMLIIRFGLWNFRNHNWDELSSGYKMRFELARTFLRTPKILLLDEPLANLDVLAQQLILEDLKNLSQSLAHPLGIILSSQQLFEVEKISDKVLFLRNGVPTHLAAANSEQENLTVLELDIAEDRDTLNRALAQINVQEIRFNGGIYQLTIAEANGFNAVLLALIQHQIHIRYVRDISQSTRRLFV
jgi:ABC-2 type transport system ATP-binding protein